MKSRGKTGGWSAPLGLPAVLILCIFVFFLGFFGSSLLSQQAENEFSLHPRRHRVLNEKQYEPLPRGDSGDDSLTTIPFQNFATHLRYSVQMRCASMEPLGWSVPPRLHTPNAAPLRMVLLRHSQIHENTSSIGSFVLSWMPRAQYFPGFATAQQCESIIKMAEVRLAPSTLALRKGDTTESTKEVRTSSGMFISAYEDQTGTLDLIEKKIERATMIPRDYGEAFNVLRYEVGQRYLQHYDTFNPIVYGPQKSQRMASFLLYLSDVEEGGETMFPLENGESKSANHDLEKCYGLKVKPRKGDGLLFYTLYPNGTIDPASLHGGCAVIKGQKWVATKWIRNQEEFY